MGRRVVLFWLVLQSAGFGACADRTPGDAGRRGAAPVEAVSVPPAAGGEAPAAASGQLLVKIRPGADGSRVAQLLSEAGLAVVRKISPDLLLVEITRGASPDDVIRQLEAHPEIQYAEPNTTRTLKVK